MLRHTPCGTARFALFLSCFWALPAFASGIPLGLMASVTGDVSGTIITLNDDAYANLIQVQYLPGAPGGPGYRLTTDGGDGNDVVLTAVSVKVEEILIDGFETLLR